jgi:hypothetical protein
VESERSRGEELVVGQQARSLQLVYCFVNHLFLVHDFQREEADQANNAERDAQKQEELVDIHVSSSPVRPDNV